MRSLLQLTYNPISVQLLISRFRTTFMLLVLYGCEIWLVIIRREQTLRMFEYRVLRKIFWRKREEVRGDC